MSLDYRARFETALTFEQFVAGANKNQELWRGIYRLAQVPPDLVGRVAALPAPRHLLILVEDWCGDAVNTVPPIVRLAEQAGTIDVRLLGRDANPDIMDAHLTTGSRSIPVVMVLDEQYIERGWWGPRPTELQNWVMRVGMQMPSPERYHEIRTWYARDHGRTTLQEVVALIAATQGAASLVPPVQSRAS